MKSFAPLAPPFLICS